jgi:hypothetical protein
MGTVLSRGVVNGRICRYSLRFPSPRVGSVAPRRFLVRDVLRDESRRSSPLKVTFPSQEIGERNLVEMMSGERSRLPPRERSNDRG